MATKTAGDDQSLKRLGGGRWQTRDERFTIEPQSGTWVIVDSEQVDDLGLPLVRGPYRSLTEAKAAVTSARGAAAPESPLAERVKAGGGTATAKPKAGASTRSSGASRGAATKDRPEPSAPARRVRPAAAPEPPPEPRWISDLGPRDRGRARRLIEQLTKLGARDAEGVVRQDLTGDVPTVARHAIADQLAAVVATTGKGDTRVLVTAVERMLAAIDDGRDDDLGVRWRLVDGDGRPIGLSASDLRAAIKRTARAGGADD